MISRNISCSIYVNWTQAEVYTILENKSASRCNSVCTCSQSLLFLYICYRSKRDNLLIFWCCDIYESYIFCYRKGKTKKVYKYGFLSLFLYLTSISLLNRNLKGIGTKFIIIITTQPFTNINFHSNDYLAWVPRLTLISLR